MEEVAKRNRNPFIIALVAALLVFVVLPVTVVCLSFVGRVSTEAVIPDSFTVFFRIPDTVRFADRLLAHESLPDLLADQSLSAFAPAVASIRDSGITGNALARLLGKGNLEGAVLENGRIIAAYDLGFVSPLMSLAPFFADRIPVKNLYFVQSGGLSRFEYRSPGGKVWYITPRRNLLIFTNDESLAEVAQNAELAREDAGVPEDIGTPVATDSLDAPAVAQGENAANAIEYPGKLSRRLGSSSYDIGFLVSSRDALDALAKTDETIGSIVGKLDVADELALTVRIQPKKIDVTLRTRISSKLPELNAILAKESVQPRLSGALPGSAQYTTLITGISSEKMVSALKAVSPQSIVDSIDRADKTASSVLGMGFDELIYSWAGDELAVFGLEGRPRPVFALKVADEKKRKAVFDAAIATLAVTEDSSFVIDGVRIPRLKLPDFLSGLLGLFKVSVPSPYYLVENGWIYLSESPENLLATVGAIKKGETLEKNETWKTLSASSPPRESLTLFYSLDRAIPFFLKGRGSVSHALQLYRQGLACLSVDSGDVVITLSVIPGSGGGLMPLPGYPVDLGGRAGTYVLALPYSASHAARLVTVVDGTRVLSVDFATLERYAFDSASPVWCVPSSGLDPEKPEEASLWVVTDRGDTSLVTGNLEVTKGFPVSTSESLSASPLPDSGRVFLPLADGTLRAIDSSGSVAQVTTPFTDPLKSPPSASEASARRYFAAYPKSFSGMLWLMDGAWSLLPGWPVSVSGIAFGSPVLCPSARGMELAFLTQSGEMTLRDEAGRIAQGFPVRLPGVFFFQPAYDGEFLWAVSSSGVLYKVALDGTVLSQQIPDFTAENGMVLASDVDGDGVPEIFVSGDGNALFGYTRAFALMDGFPLPIWGTPAIADVNGDGTVECAGVGLDNRLYCWQFRKKRSHR